MKRFIHFTLAVARSPDFWLAAVLGAIGVALLCLGFSVSTHIPIIAGSVKTIFAGVVVALLAVVLGMASILRTIDPEPGVVSKTYYGGIPEVVLKGVRGNKLAAAAEIRESKN